ncbi:MAG TPA: sugar ABC transporter permease [Bacillota bacterium]|nr:sugar ABC transporter permease [Bacillota bacterium]
MSVHLSKYRANRGEALYGYLFILPMVIGFILFLLGPILYSFYLSFTNWSLLGNLKFIGIANYKRAFFEDPTFIESVKNTFRFTMLYAPLKVALGLALAIALRDKIAGITFFRTVIFTPVITSFVVWAIAWKMIFATDYGLINQILKYIGITGPNWLYNKDLAIYVVIFVSLLKTVGMNMVLFLSALQDIPEELYEAGLVDGANRWQSFRKITLPLLTPSIFMVTMITLISSLKVFSSIYVMTDGGPARSTYVLVYYLYQQAFKAYDFGYASTIAYVLFFSILGFTLIQWAVRKKWVYNEE